MPNKDFRLIFTIPKRKKFLDVMLSTAPDEFWASSYSVLHPNEPPLVIPPQDGDISALYLNHAVIIVKAKAMSAQQLKSIRNGNEDGDLTR